MNVDIIMIKQKHNKVFQHNIFNSLQRLLQTQSIITLMHEEENEAFIGTKLKAIPRSNLLYSNQTQILLNSKRQIIKLDTANQTFVYSNIDDERIIFTTYHSSLKLYVILTEKHILAVNNEGQLIKRLNNQEIFGSKFVFLSAFSDGYYGIPHQRQDFIIFIKGDNLYTGKIIVHYERQLIKNKGICDVHIEYGCLTVHQSPQYIEYAKHLMKQDILILWNTFECYVYSIPKTREEGFERLYIYNKICRRQNLALDYAISTYYKIMIVSYQSGVIKIYNFDQTRKYIHELKGHQNDCFSIFIPQNNQHFLYSAAIDNTVRIWNLRDYQEVYSLQLDILIQQVYFITQKLLFINSNQMKEKSYLCEMNTNLLDPIVNENKSGHLIKMKCNRQWCMSIYQNNYVQFFVVTGSGNQKKPQKIEYPEQYGLIRDIYQIDINNYIIALEKGFSLVKFNKNIIASQNFQLKKLVYNESIVKINQDDRFIELIHQKLLGTYIFNVISDWKNIPLSIKVTAVYFHQNVWLPKWDSSHQQKVQAKANPSIYCMLGTSKGQLFFVDINNKNNYYTKVQFHIIDIIFIREIKLQKRKDIDEKGDLYFLSISNDKMISIWKLSHYETPNELYNINYNRDFTFIELYQNYIVLGQKTGQLFIIQIQINNDQVIMRKSNNTGGHLRSIICGDYMRYEGFDLFLSGGEDSVIKIWMGLQKQLIFQLKLFGIISTANFIQNRLNLIVCHNQQISFLRVQKLKSLNKIDQKLIQLAKGRDKQKDCSEGQFLNILVKGLINSIQRIDIRDFFYQLKQMSPLSPKKSYLQSKIKYKPAINYSKDQLNNSDIKERISLPNNQKNKMILLMPLAKTQRQRTNASNLTKSKLQSYSQARQIHNVLSSDRFHPTSKRRFHINSSKIQQEQFVLPKINIKNSKRYTKKAKFEENSNNQLLQKLRQGKQKAFSMVGRLQQKL